MMRSQVSTICRQSLLSIPSASSSRYHRRIRGEILCSTLGNNVSQNYRRNLTGPTRNPIRRTDPSRIINEAIASDLVQIAGISGGGLSKAEPLQQVFQSLNRDTHVILQVAARSPDGYPIVKVIEKTSLENQPSPAQRPKKAPKSETKSLELGWVIDDNDLAHRLKKLGQFLEQGKRVEVLLAQKRRKRKPTPEEAENLVRKVKEHAASIDGAREALEMDGIVGSRAVLTFQGRKATASAIG